MLAGAPSGAADAVATSVGAENGPSPATPVRAATEMFCRAKGRRPCTVTVCSPNVSETVMFWYEMVVTASEDGSTEGSTRKETSCTRME